MIMNDVLTTYLHVHTTSGLYVGMFMKYVPTTCLHVHKTVELNVGMFMYDVPTTYLHVDKGNRIKFPPTKIPPKKSL